MGEIFNFQRFILLVRRVVAERGIKILGSILFILICMLCFMFVGYSKPSIYNETRLMFLFFGLLLGPILYIGILAAEFQNNSMSISYLMLPSSTFEKWLLNCLLGISLYVLVFTLAYRFLDTWFVNILHEKYDTTGIGHLTQNLKVLSFDDLYYYLPMIFGIMLALTILIGYLHFRKNALVYSLLIALGVFFSTITFHYIIINLFLEGTIIFEGSSVIPFYGVSVMENANVPKEYYLKSDYTLEEIIFFVGIPAICTLSVAYYYALKEKEL